MGLGVWFRVLHRLHVGRGGDGTRLALGRGRVRVRVRVRVRGRGRGRARVRVHQDALHLAVCAGLRVEALGRDGVDLVNEDDRGRVLARLGRGRGRGRGRGGGRGRGRLGVG